MGRPKLSIDNKCVNFNVKLHPAMVAHIEKICIERNLSKRQVIEKVFVTLLINLLDNEIENKFN